MTAIPSEPGALSSFGALVQHSAGLGSAPALGFQERTVSHAGLAARVLRLAAGLRAHGLARGDRVAPLVRNCPELLELFLAAALSEIVVVPLNYRLAPTELRWILEDVEPAIVVVGPGLELGAEVVAGLPAPPVMVTLDPARRAVGELAYEDLVTGEDAAAPTPPAADPGLPVMISYTGGTTGTPKGVVLTQGGFLASMAQEIEGLDLGRETLLAAMPLFHIGIVHPLAVLSQGGQVLLRERVDLDEIVQAVVGHAVTMTVLLPTTVADLVDAAGDHDLSSLRRLLYGAAPMPPHVARRASARFGPVLVGVYGLTESGGVVSALPGADHRDEQAPELASVGRALPGIDIACHDDAGRALAPGQEGEIVIRSRGSMAGYWRQPDLSAEALRDGWLHTGDIGVIDERGYIFLRDRKSNMIITGGENVYPREVEDVLLAHPDVLEVGVVGQPDARWGEAVTAYVVCHPGRTVAADALTDFCRAALADYKRPKRVVFLDALPRTVVGKLDRRALRSVDTSPEDDGADRAPERRHHHGNA